MAKEAAKAVEAVAYEHGVVETEARLIVEVRVGCRDYCVRHTTKPLIGQESLLTPI